MPEELQYEISECWSSHAQGFNINIPLPAGCGHGAYELAFESVVLPSVRRFRPDLILVSSGFDASFADPLGKLWGSFVVIVLDADRTICCKFDFSLFSLFLSTSQAP